MRVLVCVVLLVAVVAAEPQSYRQFKANFEVNEGKESSENMEGSVMKEERKPYAAAGYKPLREFKLPNRLIEVRRPSTNQDLPSHEHIKFRKLSKPHSYYGIPEEEKTNSVGSEMKEHKRRRNEIVSLYKTPLQHYIYPSSEYGPPKQEENVENENRKKEEEKNEKTENNSEEIENIVESKENSEKSEESSEESSKELESSHKTEENRENRNKEKEEFKEHTDVKEHNSHTNERKHKGNKQKNTENIYHSEKENDNGGKKEKSASKSENKEIEIEEVFKDGVDDEIDINPVRPFYIVVQSSPEFKGIPFIKESQVLPKYEAIPFANPVQFAPEYKTVPIQRQIDLSKIGYSSYYQQSAVDSAPFSYYFQPKFQQSPFLPYSSNPWENQ